MKITEPRQIKSTPVFQTLIIMFLAAFSVYFTLIICKNVILTFIVYYFICCIGIPILDVLVLQKRNLGGFFSSIGFTLKGFESGKIKKSLITGILHGIIIYGLMLFAYFILRNKVELNNVLEVVQQWGIPYSKKWMLFLIVVFFNGFVEEIFWRGYCFSRLKQSIGGWQAVLVITFFYTSYHFVTLISFFGFSVLSISLIITVFSAGIIWGWMRKFFNNIWAPAIGHVLATCGYMTIFMLI